MKKASLWKAAVVAVAAGSCLAGVTLAGGDQVRQDNGNGYGATPRTGTAAVTGVQQKDQTRSRARDGSCQTTVTQQRDRTRDRTRDASCQATASQQRDRARDGSCRSR
jgi:hypothetical protein